MDRKNEPNRSAFDRIRTAIERARRAIVGGDDGNKEYADPRIGQMRDHERRKMNDLVELAEERGTDEEHGRNDGSGDEEGDERY